MNFKDYTILIIDDNPTNLGVVVDFLENDGFNISIARNGEVGIKRASLVKPDIILLDVMMPGIDGFETCRQLKIEETTKDIPVIFMTALDSIDDKVKGFEVGGVDYVTKPIQCGEVLARINSHLNIRDLTLKLNAKVEELTQTRQELIQSEKMASLGRLVAGFAHEINTPLGVAIGSASSLQVSAKKVHRLIEQDEVDVDELLATLDSISTGFDLTLANLERAVNLVTSFKRTAIDQTSNEELLFFVKEVIQDTVNTLQNQFRRTEIQIEIDCASDLKIQSIPGALEQILTNLLMNSLLHGFDEGKKAGTISISAQLIKDELLLEYQDDGQGMSVQHVEKVFEPFFTTYRASGGSGLGMYICYNIVTTQLQGHISCESEQGKGVYFKITYPRIHLNPR
ncbi:hybrid sensor histidine kinase/response regulator [Candidatus Albibeggiatoa sp. nov. NOAA]|uniref:hybrid sensor histidine kinase/response regulator n=1 Tax=Candidatus Albibeggiatoa sp. nov. NOAA TaxID=3162724 RepID=UPI0032FF8E40|nr:hybrid sensor histidine kinase/response regulator [Thiotrichaceae bacterium]